MSETSFISFIDLVGVSEMARFDKESYHHCLEEFMKAIEDKSPIISDCGSIYFFSDCAYLESYDIEKLLELLSEIRRDLLKFGYFFKGAVSPGKLHAEPVFSSEHTALSGHYFGEDIIDVYSAHNELKGIGIKVSGINAISDMIKEKYLINSCFLRHTNSIRADTFVDIKYGQEELTKDNLRAVLRRMFESYTKSKRIARYYLSLIISMIQSTNFSNIDDKDPKSIPAMYDFVEKGIVESHFADLSGGEFIYYALINKLWIDRCSSVNKCQYLLNKMFNKKKILKAIEHVPECIFSVEHKRDFLQHLGNQKLPT